MTTPGQRQALVAGVHEAVQAGARQDPACRIVGLDPRTHQRWQRGGCVRCDQRPARIQTPAHTLTGAERQTILMIANSPEFAALPPSQIVPRLADKGRYVASESSFYRVLRAAHQLTHRGSERPRKAPCKPRALCATAPNRLYSWDISYLPTRVRGQFVYLYLFMDIFSRKIVGWQIYDEECGEQASALLKDLCQQEGIQPHQVILHSDNGGPMKGATLLATLQALGIVPSLSRPSVSNDNPYSESLFRTLKYRPAYPVQRFADLAEARHWAARLVTWYNHEHRHSAIGFVTPVQRHTGTDIALLARRAVVYAAAKARHPQRWSGTTRNWRRVDEVHLNPDPPDPRGETRPRTPDKRAA